MTWCHITDRFLPKCLVFWKGTGFPKKNRRTIRVPKQKQPKMGDFSKLNSKWSNFCYVWAQFGPLNPITSPQTLLAADQRLYTNFPPSANDFRRKPYSKSLKIRTLGLVSSFTVKTQPFQNLFAKKGMGSIVFFDQHSQQTKRPSSKVSGERVSFIRGILADSPPQNSFMEPKGPMRFGGDERHPNHYLRIWSDA